MLARLRERRPTSRRSGRPLATGRPRLVLEVGDEDDLAVVDRLRLVRRRLSGRDDGRGKGIPLLEVEVRVTADADQRGILDARRIA